MSSEKIRPIYSVTLVILDAMMVAAAFVLAYRLRTLIPWPAELVNEIPLSRYAGLMLIQIFGVIVALAFYRQYYLPRAASRVDQFYSVFAGVSIGTMMAVEALKFLAGLGSPRGVLRLYEGDSGRFHSVKIPKRADCPACN